MAIENDLLTQAIEETKYLHTNEIFLVRDLFKGDKCNHISQSDRLLLRTLFLILNRVHISETYLKPIKKTSSIQQKYKVSFE